MFFAFNYPYKKVQIYKTISAIKRYYFMKTNKTEPKISLQISLETKWERRILKNIKIYLFIFFFHKCVSPVHSHSGKAVDQKHRKQWNVKEMHGQSWCINENETALGNKKKKKMKEKGIPKIVKQTMCKCTAIEEFELRTMLKLNWDKALSALCDLTALLASPMTWVEMNFHVTERICGKFAAS